jgi:hypothetical protein
LFIYSFVWVKILLCSPGWSWNHDSPALASWVLGLQVWATIPNLESTLKWWKWRHNIQKSIEEIHRGKIAINVSIKKNLTSNNLTYYLRQWKIKEQTKPKSSRGKEIIRLRMDNNKSTEYKNNQEQQNQNHFFEKVNKID